MTKKMPIDQEELDDFKQVNLQPTLRDQQNRRLLEWLSDDSERAKLFKLVNASGGELTFYSRDAGPRQGAVINVDTPLARAIPDHVPVRLVTDRTEIGKILRNEQKQYSSRIYAELGGGNFMLALDPWATAAHGLQRAAFKACFPNDPGLLLNLAHAACQAAAVTGLQTPDFDLAAFAEQAALRCCQMLMGYALKDYPPLGESLRAAYKGLVYQVQGRHFVTDPVLIPAAQQAMLELLARTSTLIDAYAAKDKHALEGCKDPSLPAGITPVLERLAEFPSALNGEQRAIVAVGAAIGTVGNVQAAVCIAVKALFKSKDDLLPTARALARGELASRVTANFDRWQPLLAPLLRANPPIPYLPRLEVDADGNKVCEVLLALGGGTETWKGPGEDDPLVWGLHPDAAAHHCAGQALAWPLIVEIVRQVMALPDLAQGLDPLTAKVKGLTKTRGFACESYPLSYRIDKRRAQTSLNVAMRIKAPIKENVDHVRAVILAGAPAIERLLRESRHVHFAWFEIIEADTVLVLHTVYDGPFGAYLQHFALQAGDLFDVLCSLIEDPPPIPVRKYPDEFAAHLLRYNRPPAMGYFFSAYPRSEVARIVRQEGPT